MTTPMPVSSLLFYSSKVGYPTPAYIKEEAKNSCALLEAVMEGEGKGEGVEISTIGRVTA
jgi:hypothetical protein